MTWQDAPVVGGMKSAGGQSAPSAPSAPAGGGGWQSAPLVGVPSSKSAATAAPAQQHGALYNALFKEGTGGTAMASANEGVFPAIRDYALAGADDLTLGALGAHTPTSLGNMIKQAHSNLGPMDYVESGAAYGLGPGKVLAPIGKAIGGAGIGGMAAEGALAGGISSGVQGDNPLTGAATGAALGGAAGLVGKGVGKAFDKPGSVDPAQAVASTIADEKAAWAPMQGLRFDKGDIAKAYTNTNVPPGLQPGIDHSFDGGGQFWQGDNSMLGRQAQAIYKGANTADAIADYARDLREHAAKPGTSNGERIMANQIADNLTGSADGTNPGLFGSAQPINPPTLPGTPGAPSPQPYGVGDAAQIYGQAKAASMKARNAEALQQLQQQQRDFGQGPGGVPQTQAETYYKPGDPEYEAWARVAQAGKRGMDPSYVAGHWGADIGESLGAATMGFPGYVVGKGLGYLGGKFLGKKAVGNLQNRSAMKAYQAEYPILTGVQPSGGSQVDPAVGDAIKSLMLGGAY